jgi:hypothetical protein
MLGILRVLRPRYDRYTKCITAAEAFCGSSRKTLAEMALSAQVSLPVSADEREPDVVAFRICWNLVSCIVSAVVVIGTIIVTEGETDDEDDDPPQGDFPEPDPDGDRPA